MEKLKPCPFCGSEAKLDENANGLGYPLFYLVYCPNCAAVCRMYEEKDAAIRAWNRRINDEVNKLKPCPFCGSENIVLGTYLGDVHDVRCVQCQATFVGDSEQECIEKWNRRAIQPMPQGIIDSLEKMAARMYDWLEMCNGCPADDYCGLEGSRPNSEQCINAMAKAMARAAGWEV